MIRPGVDHLITVLPAADHRQTAKSRKVASGLRSTLKRYNVTLTERKIDEQIKVYGRYENGATETI